MSKDDIKIKKITTVSENPLRDKIQSTNNPNDMKTPQVADITEDGSIPNLLDDTEKKGRKIAKRLKLPRFMHSRKFILGIASLLFILIILVAYSALATFSFYRRAMDVKTAAEQLAASAESQDLVIVEAEVKNTRDKLGRLNTSYKFVSWMKVLPYAGVYVDDAGHAINAGLHGLDSVEILLATVEPYADLIGFDKGQGEQGDAEKTAKDRIDFVVQSIPDILPKVDELSGKMTMVESEIAEINPQDYPEEFQGIALRSQIEKAKEAVGQASRLVTQGRPLLEKAPEILGLNGKKTYLVLFQNDKELRPTGGFMTAYSIMDVENATFNPVSSDDIYNLDARYTPAIPAPDPLVKYIKGPYILNKNMRFRDMNWSADFSEAMELIIGEGDKLGIGEDDIDGIISVDTQVLVNLLEVLGTIGVPGYGNYSTEIIPECNCPQVIYELESFADNEGPVIWDPLTGEIIQAPPNIDNRKKIIGPLMNSIMSNALGQPKEKVGELVEAGYKSVMEKHVLFYLSDDEEQAAVEQFGIGGTIKEFDGDYLHVNDANLGGRKSNLYVTHEVVQDVEISRDGSVTKTVTLTYKNPEKHDGWLNSVLPNYVRVYVPEGSELIDSSGFEESEETYDELGKTIFAGFFELRPQGVSKVTLTYKLPFKVTKEYNLLVQKQPGKDTPLYTVNLGDISDESFLRMDREYSFKI